MNSAKNDSTQDGESFSLISNQKLLSLYAAMRACRDAEEAAKDAGKEVGSASSILGHEAAVVGAAIDLLGTDTVASRLVSAAVLRSINAMVSLVSDPVATQPIHDDARDVTVVFASSHTMSPALWRKALDGAIRGKLPILFVWIGAGTKQRSYVPPKIRGYAFPSIAVDGHDVVAVYRVASEAIGHARKGHGPTLIECLRLNAGCPLRNMEDYLASKALKLPF